MSYLFGFSMVRFEYDMTMFENDMKNVQGVMVIEVLIVVGIVQCSVGWCERQVYVSVTCCEMRVV